MVVALHDAAKRADQPAGAVQPQTPRERPGVGLPVLPCERGTFQLRRRSANGDMHDLPFTNLDARARSRACPRKLDDAAAAPLEPSG